MKKLILSTIAIFCFTICSAQTGLFIQPYVGGGVTSIHHYPYYFKTNPISSQLLGIAIGKNIGLLRLETGLSYLTVGDQLILGPEYSLPHSNIISYNRRVQHSYISVPVKVGIDLWSSKRLSVIPTVGALPSLNIISSVKEKTVTKSSKKTERNYNYFGYATELFALFGSASLNIEYRLNKHMSLSLIPACHRMIINSYSNFSVPNGVGARITGTYYWVINSSIGLRIQL